MTGTYAQLERAAEFRAAGYRDGSTLPASSSTGPLRIRRTLSCPTGTRPAPTASSAPPRGTLLPPAQVPGLRLRVIVRGEVSDGAVALEDLLAAEHDVDSLPAMSSADDRHLILYSSGTESRPKGCLHTWNTSSFPSKQGRAPIPASLVTEAAEKFAGCRVVSAYGSSEVMMATVCRPTDSIERVASSDGAAVPGVDLRIVGLDEQEAATGQDGEIRYRGPGRLLEYWNRSDLRWAACRNTRFSLTDMKADLRVGWAYVDRSLTALVAGTLTAADAAIAKLWITEMQSHLVDRCLQFFDGYGFMAEYEISRLFTDARIQRIYGGSSEIMREVIARSL